MTATYLAPAAYTMFYSIVGFIVGVPILLKALPHIPVLNRMILEAPGADAAAAPLAPRETPLARLQIGDMGEATTALRPSGTAVFAGHKVDVVADGQFLQRGDQLVIQDISGNRVLVKARS
jgi:membrane-bound serine protease (ClpP class)